MNASPWASCFFSSNEKNAYSNVHQDCFLRIAGQISTLIEKSRLYQEMHELNQKLLVAHQELEYQATYDSLTGIYNRRTIIEHLNSQLERAKRHDRPLGIIMLDVDHFKSFNDTHGHLAGDTVLKMVASRMKECLREYDYIGRYGGEEFLVVLCDVDYEKSAKAAERLNQVVAGENIAFGEEWLAVTIRETLHKSRRS
jgi:diguanylate cyclase (GGDEF)-like protein